MRLGQALLESLKSRGVGGDTEIGFIKGRLSHLTDEEDQRLMVADAMDMGRNRVSRGMAEDQISREGVGTLNRETGLPQYHPPEEGQYHDDSLHTHGLGATSMGETDYTVDLYTSAQAYTPENLQAQYEKQSEAGGYIGQLGFEAATGMTDIEKAGYLSSEFDIGEEYSQYITPFETKPFEFLEEGFGLEQRGLGQQLQKGRRTLSSTAREGLFDLSSGTKAAKSQSGMAYSGTIQQQFERQKKGLFEDYSTGMQDLQQSYTLGMDESQLGYTTDVYGEQQRQMERFYDDIGGVVQLKKGGGGGSCFIAGTKVLMADDSEKNIEDITVGEFVKGVSSNNEVLELDYTVLGDRRLYSINGGNYFVTAEHPFMTKDGWKSINPKATLKESHEAFSDKDSIGILDVGDILITSGDEIEIKSISLKSGDSQMPLYNFYLSGDHTYNADGYLVHNKGCCFIVLEVEEKNGLNKDVRQYRDEMMNDQNRSGYYKLAQVSVPLMRKSKLIKWFFKYFFVKPAKSWAKWHYHKKGIGWIFEPLRRFWLGLFTYLGKEHKLRVDNG